MPRAPRRCPGDDYQCPNLITTTKYCPDHDKPWRGPRTASSTVTTTAEWQRDRVDFLAEHPDCEIRYPGICTGRATVVDKIQPAARRPDLARDKRNWQGACEPCNDEKARTVDRGAKRRR